jgi:colicin import membrane protein
LRIAEAQRRADEERRFVEARRAEEEARAAELQRLQAQRLAEDQQKAEERRLAAQAEAERARLGAVREAEAQRLAERLRQAREDRERAEQQTAAGTGRGFEPDLPLPSMRNSLGMSEEAASAGASVAAGGDHVAVLLVMQPGNRGIRRHNKSADPVLCTYSGCFVSNGPDRAVTYFPGHSGLGLSRTFGERAGSCSNSLGCVFRGIELAAIRDHLGPIDMRVIRHDRREMQHGIAVSDCRLERGRLACTRGIHSSDYTMWIVPESLASRAGVQMLEQAVAEGLPEMERVGYAPSLR